MTNVPFKIRIFAFFIDYVVIVLYGIVVVGMISFVFRPYMTSLFSNSPITAQVTGFITMTLPVSVYFIICESSKWQGTWGKRKIGIRVVNGAGERIGIGRSALRTTIKFLPWEAAHFGIWRLMLPTDFSEIAVFVILTAVNFVILLYLIIPLTNTKRKNVYDWIARTEVVR